MLNQEREVYERVRAYQAELKETAKFSDNVKAKIWTEAQYVRYMIEDSLRAQVENDMEAEQLNMAPIFQDLLRDAFNRINWQEVAEQLTME